MDLSTVMKTGTAAGTLLVSLYTGGSWLDARYAHTEAVDALTSDTRFTNLRLEEKILTDRVAAIQTRMWSLEDRYHHDLTTAPPAVREEYRKMVVDLDDVRQQIQSVMAQYRAVGYPATMDYYRYERPHR